MKTARVVVIDEDREEALLLLEALGKAGIGAIYVKGDEEKHLPSEPCTGIRLVFLDLQLQKIDEPRNYIPFTVKVLRRSVQIDPGVTGIICWTQHTDEIEFLKAELAKQELAPAFVMHIENKLDIRNTGNLDRILAEIERITAPIPGRDLLTTWEQSVHDATTSATGTLWQLAEAGEEPQLMSILAAVAVGAADEKINSANDAASALYAGLAAVQADAIEDTDATVRPRDQSAEALSQAVARARRTPLSPQQRACLNQVLLTTRCQTAQPGNVYLPQGWQPQEKFPVKQTDKAIRGLLYEFFPQQRDKKAFVKAVQSASTPCLVELTPACDFAQGKALESRMLGGLLIESPGAADKERLWILPPESRVFAKDTEFFWVDESDFGTAGSFKLILNARKLVTMPFDKLRKHRAVCRLRQQVIADIRAWFASHAARPGYVAVH